MWQTDEQTDQYHKKKHFRWWNISNDICRSFWFDANRSTFDDDYGRKTIFYSFDPSDLDIRALDIKIAHRVTASQRCFMYIRSY